MKQHTLIIFCFFIFCFVSCKKDRTCECSHTIKTTTIDVNGLTKVSAVSISTTTTTYKDIKKSTMTSLCKDFVTIETIASTNGLANSTSEKVSEVNCQIK